MAVELAHQPSAFGPDVLIKAVVLEDMPKSLLEEFVAILKANVFFAEFAFSATELNIPAAERWKSLVTV